MYTKIEPKFNLQHALLKKIFLTCMVERPYSRTWVVLLYIIVFFHEIISGKRYFVEKQAQFSRCFYACVKFSLD